MASLVPLKHQVEEYKNRAALAEFRLAEANEQLQKHKKTPRQSPLPISPFKPSWSKSKLLCPKF
jgi:hypothetical protein